MEKAIFSRSNDGFWKLTFQSIKIHFPIIFIKAEKLDSWIWESSRDESYDPIPVGNLLKRTRFDRSWQMASRSRSVRREAPIDWQFWSWLNFTKSIAMNLIILCLSSLKLLNYSFFHRICNKKKVQIFMIIIMIIII